MFLFLKFRGIIDLDLDKGGYIVKERVEEVLNLLRPSLQADGGDVELIDVTDDGVVQVKLTGACGGCPFAVMTLKEGIERAIKEELPEVKEVVAL
ncbi:MAG: hypothetical protein PWQ59_893 [Thermoanaerobacterium sp.]|nr:hypothetical protein [Thermoanaerobacterium sp.]MDN5316560.1 hypothetical protein [Thermoanaerobacterium sp.]